ncbi:MAG: GSCFA domain-containing protein [Alistipes sp.]|nr:GSCFA domain-containing protein [Alistipes sp.]
MKFRTEIEIAPLPERIGYRHRLLAVGSCFAQHIAAKLADAKFPIETNPTGILFNPLSIVEALRSYEQCEPVCLEELHHDGEVWFHYDFHGSFSDADAQAAAARMTAGRAVGASQLRQADFVLLTFGTAWVYERAGRPVANCHRQPASEFVRRRLTVEEIVAACGEVFGGVLANKQIILTVSPVRHLGDGLAGNGLSKAILRTAAAELEERHANVHYFPAYEIVMDDLRDYRFYADDLVHPTPQAIEYVWEKFVGAALDDEAQRRLPEVEAIVAAARHVSRNPQGKAHADFCRRCLERIAALPDIRFDDEKRYFERYAGF